MNVSSKIYTLQEIQAIVVKAGCCSADLSYLLLNAERFNTYDISCAKRKFKYINRAIEVLCRFEPIRGIILSTHSIKVITTIETSGPVTIVIDGQTVIDNKTYLGTPEFIANQIAYDINQYAIPSVYHPNPPKDLSATVYGDVVVISFDNGGLVDDGPRPNKITIEYVPTNIFVTTVQNQPGTTITIPAIDATCLTNDDIQNIVEQLNKVCGCCDCKDNSDIIKDI